MRSLLRVAALFAILVAPLPAGAQVWIWSQTPTSNATIDPTINWQEGMPPSAVDDSARATMAGVAKWRDDGNGLVTLTGTSTAYAATTNQGNQGGGVSSLTPGYRTCFSPNVVNGAAPTLAVDSQASKPLRKAPNTNLVGGELQIGTPYCATYFSSNGGEYILNEFYVTIIGAGAIGTTQLANGAVTYAKIQNETNATILGNNSGGSAAPEELTLGSGLGFSGTTVLVPSNGIVSSMIAAGAVGSTQLATSGVTYAKIQNETNATLLGNDSGSSAAPSELTVSTPLSFTSSTNLGVANSAITYAKIQNESASTLLGNPTGSGAAPSEITLGSGLTFSGSALTPNIGAAGLATSAVASYEQPVNFQLNATVAGNQLTLAVKGINGSDPSASNPVLVGFRSQTTGNGTNIVGSITAATSFTLATTSSQGCTTAVVCRLWVELICQTESSGSCTSVLIGASLQSSTTQCFPLMENQLQSTGSGTTGGTTINTINTSVASLTSKAIRIVGYVEATWTSGTGWTIGAGSAADPSVQVFSPGMKKPCDIVQTVYATNTNSTSVSSTTKTATGTTASITPTSVVNLVLARAMGWLEESSGSAVNSFAQLGRNSSSNLFGTMAAIGNGSSGAASINSTQSLEGLDAPAAIASTTYTVFIWSGSAANTATWLGTQNTFVTQGSIVLEEIMG